MFFNQVIDWSSKIEIKGTVQRDFLSQFFHQPFCHGQNPHAYKPFRILSNFREVIRILNFDKSTPGTKWLRGVEKIF